MVVYAFGFNALHQTRPTATPHHSVAVFAPEKLQNIRRIVQCFADNTLALTDGDKLVFWGFDPQTKSVVSTPTSFGKFGHRKLKCVYGNGTSVIGAVDEEGRVWECSLAELKNDAAIIMEDISDIAYRGMDDVVVAIDGTGTLYTWTPQNPTPNTLVFPPSSSPTRFVHLSFFPSTPTSSHFLALNSSGTVYSWGSNRFGQLGHGNLDFVASPTPLEALQGIPVLRMACGMYHSAAITEGGDLYTFGWDSKGRLGIGAGGEEERNTALPQLAVFLDEEGGEMNEGINVVDVACGADHTVAVDGKYGQLGLAPPPSKHDSWHGNGFNIDAFRRHPFFGREQGRQVTGCVAGFWNTFVTVEEGFCL
ncbi:regulator of chromosome condensation 1/beta-lactamase-inhibitor protein II [Jimgerdemannia flammicorona]|uniref:Regulator of chromosome condensation 1/beta-lactamase-inhibitor protein II n=1 Tax=Jimgerdemannia flammicorona TaxID=994334 RepID=A0A433CTW3_9FUNG|nr:regulator of chromosome condensation 1/beta-lactamase-inhibitor protein II [Jimgerdemannia flammicorona]